MIRDPIQFLSVLALIIFFSCKSDTIDLSGKWQVELERSGALIDTGSLEYSMGGPIELPGSLAEAGYGSKTVGADYGILTPTYKFTGTAVYKRDIEIPNYWSEKEIELMLERVLWESRVYVDGQEMSTCDALGTPHLHRLGRLRPGNHRLEIRVNNQMVHNIGDKGHAYGAYMQSIWNGIVGKMELRSYDLVRITRIRTFPDIENDELRIECEIKSNEVVEGDMEVKISDLMGREVLPVFTSRMKLSPGIKVYEIKIQGKGQLKRWSEFEPEVYLLEASIRSGNHADTHTIEFGFCQVSHDGVHVLVNGAPVFLRGNLDCVQFPLSGYPATDLEDWMRIFKIYKDYGLNHVRFHSWCPPEAAFQAANRLGIYVQAESSMWIDSWMGVDMVERGRPEMDTQGHPQGLGRGDQDADAFVVAEMNRMIDWYGNHPSFIMFCIGNELGSSDFDTLGTWIRDLKAKDPRRLYAASTARKVTPYCDFAVTHHYPVIGKVRQHLVNHLDWDYEEQYRRTPVPTVAHEIGQWPVYPDWDEIEKYTGVLRPRNLQELSEIALANGVKDQDSLFKLASGKLSQLLYKDEIESFLRTPSCGGFQLLSMQDYIGQGEALIGWLDSFYDSKGITAPESFRNHCSNVVPLVKMPRYVFKAGDSLVMDVLLYQYDRYPLQEAMVKWQLENGDGKSYLTGSFDPIDYPQGMLHNVGELALLLPSLNVATQLRLQIWVENTAFKNDWPVWIYPQLPDEDAGNVFITDDLDKAYERLDQRGGKVLLLAHKLGTPSNERLAAWRPLYWSASFFPGQNIETLGMLIQCDHPVFDQFPTEYHANWQWWSICKGARGFILDDIAPGVQPMIQPVSDFHFSHKIGSLFECKTGNGSMVVCGYDVGTENSHRPEVAQLRYSILEYMNGPAFDPTDSIDFETLDKMFKQ